MKESPCRDCKNRFVGCHGQCVHYKNYRKYKDEQLEKRKKDDWDYIEYRSKALSRMSGYTKKPREK